MFFCDPVHILAEVKGQKRQIEKPLTAKDLLECVEDLMMANDLMDEVHRELIVSGGNRSMSRENALFSYRLRVIEGDGGSSRVVLLLVQKFEREKARMTLIHMETLNSIVAKGSEHSHSPNSKDHFLSKSVTLISTVEDICKSSILFIVFWKVAVEEKDGYRVAADSLHLILPGSKEDVSTLDGDGSFLRQRFTKVINDPFYRFLSLPSTGIEPLIEISSPMEKRHCDQRDFQICSRSDRISRQDPQATTVSRHLWLESNFHRKVSNAS
jgi:hypothetical protein